MMIIASLLLSLAFQAKAEIPENPPVPCYSGCTAKMTEILDKFNKASVPSLEPGIYSGECYHLSYSYNPNVTHYAGTLIDSYQGQTYLSTMFSFFYSENKYADWDLERARQEFGDEWKTSDRVFTIVGQTGQASVMYQGAPVYVYWVRQNPLNGTLYQITYWGGTYIKSFCELKKN